MLRVLLSLLFLCLARPPALAEEACGITPAEATWAKDARAAWALVRDTRLHMPDTSQPSMILFNDKCVFEFSPDGVVPARSSSHDGTLKVPDGQTVPARPLAFASVAEDGKPFFIMSLPSVWEQVLKGADRDKLTLAIFVHEFSHTQQMTGLGAHIGDLIESGVLPEEADDDYIETRFKSNAEFAKSVETERELLFEAASAPTRDEARRIASEALALGDERTKKWMNGKEAPLAKVEDVFLSFEGSGQWVGYSYLLDPKGAGLAPERAKELIRGGRRPWSQELGLAHFLVLERLSPGATAKVYGDDPQTIFDLLDEALTQ